MQLYFLRAGFCVFLNSSYICVQKQSANSALSGDSPHHTLAYTFLADLIARTAIGNSSNAFSNSENEYSLIKEQQASL